MTDRGDYQGVCLICGNPIYYKRGDEAQGVNVERLEIRSWHGQKSTFEGGGMWFHVECYGKMLENMKTNAGGILSASDH